MHRNSVRLTRLEDYIQRQRDAKIARIVGAMQEEMSADDCQLFCMALQRDIDCGSHAQFTAAELGAMARFDQMVAGRPL